jgi:endonuclease/exonuclease/phosphatase family metal-dependent hydrolase
MTPDPAPARTCPETSASSWYFPEDAGDNQRLEEWCATVGPVVRKTIPDGRFGSLDPGDSLTVVAWNVAVGSGDVLGFLHAEMGLTCSGASSELRAGSPHFALLVQEAFRSSPDVPESYNDRATPRQVPEKKRPGERLDAVDVAERCGLSLAYVAAARNGSEPRDGMREDKGVAIVSTLRLSDIIGIELPYEAARRVAVAATLHARNGGSLRVVSVHLISMAPPARILTTGNGSRLRQGLALVDALHQAEIARSGTDSTSSGPASTVLAGDFNTWSDRETTLRRLREHFPDSPPPLGKGTHGTFPTDHILFRESDAAESPRLIEESYTRIENRYHSDHHAIRATVLFSE